MLCVVHVVCDGCLDLIHVSVLRIVPVKLQGTYSVVELCVGAFIDNKQLDGFSRL